MGELAGNTILVVDDSVFIRTMIQTVIKPLGYTVLGASGGEAALQLLADDAHRVDVVITDVVMPAVGGVELMERIHELYPEITVILMTAYSSMEIVLTAIRKHAFDIILKPVEVPVLQDTLERAMKHTRLLSLEKNYKETLEQQVFEKTAEIQGKIAELEKSRAVQEAEHAALERLYRDVETIKREWVQTLDCIDDMVILVDPQGLVHRCNKAVGTYSGKSYADLVGSPLEELFEEFVIMSSSITAGTELFHEASKRWFFVNVYPFKTENEEDAGTVVTAHDTTELKLTMEALSKAYQDLQATQVQMIQAEKMASIGQLAAGVAHEINNPIGFVSSNLNTLGKYLGRLKEIVALQEQLIQGHLPLELQRGLVDRRSALKFDYVVQDLDKLIGESLDGTERVRKIVQDLKGFAHSGEDEYREADLAELLDSSINIVWNELKYKAVLEKDFAKLPRLVCYPQRLSQVFVNLLVNAGQAIDKKGRITVTTRLDGETACVAIADNGCGIEPERLQRIFEPFYTTKPVGKGTGLGLSISYDIIEKHGGKIAVDSVVGSGTTFIIRLPLRRD